MGQSTNFDAVSVGNDVATAFGNYWDHSIFGHQAKAENNVKIKKNQISVPSICCDASSTLCRAYAHSGKHRADKGSAIERPSPTATLRPAIT